MSKARRRELALEQSVPPYVIFGDVSLKEMVLYRPRDLAELRRINGVGDVKLQRYGDGFLAVLGAHEAEHGRPDNVAPLPETDLRPPAPPSTGPASDIGLSTTAKETLRMFRQGIAPAQIAERRELKTSTVHSHLARCIEEDELVLSDIFRLSDKELKTIEFAFGQLPPNAPMTLKPVFDGLQGRYSYDLLRCVQASMGES